MSSERFDKLIKQNLESVRPAYHPRAWDRFSKNLPSGGFLPWIQQYGGWAVAAMMLAGWFTTLYTLRENQEIIRQLSSKPGSNMVLENKPAQKSVPARIDKILPHTDTIYIVKKTIVEHQHFYESPPESENRVAKNGNDKNPNNLLNKPQQKYSTSPELNAQANDKETLPTKTSETNIYQHDDKNLTSDKEQVTQNLLSENHALPDTTEKVTDEDRFNMLLDSTRIIQAYNYKVLAALVDSLSEKKTGVTVFKPKKPPFRLSSLQPRLGMESLLTRHSYGIGPVVEFFPTENLGFSFGIQASTLEAENHKALRDYNSATGKFFLIQYRSYLPSKFDKIEDISIKTSVISLPISLKYYIPVKRNISLFVQSGTSLDLTAYQQVDFESYLNKSKRRNTFETDAKPYFFHNFMFGAGVQYKRSRVLAQLSPYYVYDFRNIVNTPSGSNLGLRASLWLNLFK